MSPDVLIYQDYVHNNGILYRSLCDYYGHERVGFCDAQDIINGCLRNQIHLLIMPGGADLYYCEKLNGQGNQNIRTYVESGGNYLGICAGAYYGCREIEWGKNTNQEIIGPRELNFIDCLAVGPVNEFIRNHNIDHSWKNAVQLETDTDTFLCYYNGGSIFTDVEKDAHILAKYSELEGRPAAIIEKKVGNGHIILSSPHIEYSAADVQLTLYSLHNPFYEDELKIIKQLERYDTNRRYTFEGLLKRFSRDGTTSR